MKISKIHLTNFRGISDLELNLDNKSTILFGINGVGKSTVLRGIDLLYANIIAQLLKSTKLLAELTIDDIQSGKARAKVTAEFSFPTGKNVEYYRYIEHDMEHIEKKHSKTLSTLVKCFRDQYVTENYADEAGNLIVVEDTKNMPVFVNYGVNRLVIDVPVRVPKRTNFLKLNAFDKAIESRIDFSSLFEWFRWKEDLENQEKVIGMNIEFEDRELRAVRDAMSAMFDDFKNVRIERQTHTMLLEKDGVSLNLNQLSDGEKCTIALFGDLARRLAIANPALVNPLEGEGVVLIDEIELHMHTQWQRKILRVLRQTFPNIQFIITTHSPQVLGEVDDNFKIFTMKKREGEVTAQECETLYGWDSNVILEEMLETESVTPYVKKITKDMYDALDAKDYDLAEKYADEIDELTHGRNESVAKVRILIVRGRRSNEKNTKR